MNVSGVLLSRWRLARNAILPRGGRRSAKQLGASWLGLGFTLALAGLAFVALRAWFASLAASGATAATAGAALGLVLGAASAGLLVFDLHFATSALLLDPDLELFRRAPAPPRGLFAVKLLDAFPRTATMLVVLALPAALAYAAAYPLSGWGWAALPVELLLLWTIPLGAGVALAMELARRVPPARAREALSLLSTLVLTLLWIASAFLLPRLAEPSDPLARRISGLAAAARAPWSPAQWAADAIAAAASGATAVALRAVSALALGAALALGLGAWASARNLEALQAQLAVPGARRRRGTRSARHAAASVDLGHGGWRAASSAGLGPWARSPALRQVGAIVRRDALLLSRDWTVLGDVVTAAVLWTLLPLVSLPALEAPAPLIVRAMLVTLSVSLGYEIAARSIPFERQGVAWTALAPISPGRAVAGKLLGVAIVALTILAIATASLAVAFPLPPLEWVMIMTLTLPALGLSLCFGLWSGGRFGDREWTNPRAMLSLAGRSLSAVLLILQASFWLAFGWYSGSEPFRGLPGLWIWGPLVLAGAIGTVPIRAHVFRQSEA